MSKLYGRLHACDFPAGLKEPMSPEELAMFSAAARKKAEEEFDMNDDLMRYRRLYSTLPR